MPSFANQPALEIAALAVVAAYNLPRFGQRVLAFLRDLRDYRNGR